MTSKTEISGTNKRQAAQPPAPRKAKSPGKRIVAELDPDPTSAPNLTKGSRIAALLVRGEGATINQVIAATGWLPHTVHAALTGLKKIGYAIDSDKIDGLRTCRAVAPQ